MAIGKKSGGRDFSKGTSGNPNGRPPLPPDVKEARRINQFEFERITNRLFFLTLCELRAVMKNPETPVLERMLAKLMAMAAATGDQKRIESLLSRTIGKVDTKVQAGLSENEIKQDKRPDEMTDEELDAEARKAAARILKKGN